MSDIAVYSPKFIRKFERKLRYARALEYDHRTRRALSIYDKILVKYPHCARAAVRKAYCLSKLGDSAAAADFLMRTLTRQLEHPYAIGEKCVQPLKKGSAYYNGIEEIEKALPILSARRYNGYVYRPSHSRLSPFARVKRRLLSLIPRESTEKTRPARKGAYPKQLKPARGVEITTAEQLESLIAYSKADS